MFVCSAKDDPFTLYRLVDAIAASLREAVSNPSR